MRTKRVKRKRKKRYITSAFFIICLLSAGGMLFLKPKQKPLVAEEVQKATGLPYSIDPIPQSNKRPMQSRKIKYIVIHNTANPDSTARNERDYLSNPQNTESTSWHIVVDEKEVIEAVPVTEIAYHAGDTEGNTYGIGIEICESGNFKKSEENAAKLVAYLMKHYHIPISRVTTHEHFSGKLCPRLMLSHWEDFLDKVKKEQN